MIDGRLLPNEIKGYLPFIHDQWADQLSRIAIAVWPTRYRNLLLTAMHSKNATIIDQGHMTATDNERMFSSSGSSTEPTWYGTSTRPDMTSLERQLDEALSQRARLAEEVVNLRYDLTQSRQRIADLEAQLKAKPNVIRRF